MWRDAGLIADESDAHAPTLEQAQQLAETIAVKLGLAAQNVMPAFEDPLLLLLREAEIPANIDPQFAHGDARPPVGYVLPLWPSPAAAGWISEAWQFRRGRLFLLAGEGPTGDRLPLGALPQLAPGEYPLSAPVDPLDDLGHLPDPDASHTPGEADPALPVRTALAVEPRDGRLNVFMPPLDRLEDYLVLVGAVEAAAAERKLCVRLEGYPPPDDPRSRSSRSRPIPA